MGKSTTKTGRSLGSIGSTNVSNAQAICSPGDEALESLFRSSRSRAFAAQSSRDIRSSASSCWVGLSPRTPQARATSPTIDIRGQGGR